MPSSASESPRLWLGGLALALFAMALLHISAWSSHPPDIDPINFLSALRHYSVSNDAPHAPGYPLYVGLAWLAQHPLGATYAYQSVNLAMLLGTSLLLTYIGAQLDSIQAGSVAAVLFAAHPLIWAATVIPECYIVDAFGGAALVACGLAVSRGEKRSLALFIALEFMLGLMRPTSCLLLLPAGLAAIWLSGAAHGDLPAIRWRRILIAAGGTAPALLTAYLLTVMLAGGPTLYHAAADRVMGQAFRSSSVLGGAPLRAHAAMVAHLLTWFAFWSAPVLLALALYVRRGCTSNGFAMGLLTSSWLLPALAFYTLVYYLKPTYQIIFQPALCLLLGWSITHLARNRLQSIAITLAVLLALGQGFFWLGNERLPQPLYRLTHHYFNARDTAWDRLEVAVAKAPADRLIVYVDWPGVSAQALRLIRPDGIFAVQRESGELQLNDNGTWLPVGQGNLARYTSSLVLSNDNGTGRLSLAGPPLKQPPGR